VLLACAVTRPRGWSEAVFAVPAALVVVAAGAISLPAVAAEVELLGPVVGFLAAVLVLARLCDDEGLFRACGAWMARVAARRPRRLLVQVFATASVITAVLSLDATVVLLTPVVFATAARVGVRPKPHVYACTHLSNSASLLLPVSNLTNLLAFPASGLSFTRFAALMAAPWLTAVAVEYGLFRWFFAADLAADLRPAPDTPAARGTVPLFALAVLVATLAGFVVASFTGVDPAWAAAAGAAVLAGRALVRGTVPRRATALGVVRAARPGFCLFVLALGVTVQAVVDNGLGSVLTHVLPDHVDLGALLAVAAIAAVLANLVNNLPAVLALLPIAAGGGPGLVLAVLLGVNVGPNLSYVGSLATLLWRRVLRERGDETSVAEFTRLGLLTTPVTLAASGVVLWAVLLVT
jgi:arsenical pump membrane protein